MKCEIDQIDDQECENEAVANITVSGDNGSATIEVCLDHLIELMRQAKSVGVPQAQPEGNEQR